MACGCGEVSSDREKTDDGLAIPATKQRPDVAGSDKVCVQWLAVQRVGESEQDDVPAR
ncbi:hypothetical protein Csa_007722, partial [Cucumis sativus]